MNYLDKVARIIAIITIILISILSLYIYIDSNYTAFQVASTIISTISIIGLTTSTLKSLFATIKINKIVFSKTGNT